MHAGFTALGGSQSIWVVTSSDGITPGSPDAAPSVTVYELGGSSPTHTPGAMTGPVDSKTGLYRLSITVSAGNGYARGNYVAHVSWAVSSAAKAQLIPFTVV